MKLSRILRVTVRQQEWSTLSQAHHASHRLSPSPHLYVRRRQNEETSSSQSLEQTLFWLEHLTVHMSNMFCDIIDLDWVEWDWEESYVVLDLSHQIPWAKPICQWRCVRAVQFFQLYRRAKAHRQKKAPRSTFSYKKGINFHNWAIYTKQGFPQENPNELRNRVTINFYNWSVYTKQGFPQGNPKWIE